MYGTFPNPTLVYPEHRLKPNDLMHFIEASPFTKRWLRLQLSDEDLMALQILLCIEPKGGDVIKGTGGVRKLRFSPPKWNRGARDSLRICYAHFEEYHIILLLLAYAKGEKDDLTNEEKEAIKKYLESIEEALARGCYN